MIILSVRIFEHGHGILLLDIVFGYPVDGADDVVVDRGTRWLSSSRHLAAQIGAEGS